jgi:hypothetical protein
VRPVGGKVRSGPRILRQARHDVRKFGAEGRGDLLL